MVGDSTPGGDDR